jgi:CRP-like cAMP-binding protein
VCIFEPVIKSNSILKKEPRVAEFIAERLENHFTKPEEEIITEGSEADALFYVASGEVKVYVTDPEGDKTFVCYLGKGAHFGEIGLIYHTPRTATVESVGYCNLAKLVSKDYETMVSRFPHILERFRKATTLYDDSWKKFLLEILFQAEYFEGLKPEAFQELAYLMHVQKYDTDSYVFRPGEPIDCIFIVTEGRLELSVTLNERHLHMLKKQSQAKGMEESPTIPKVAKDLSSFSDCWNFTMKGLGNLKLKAEVVPVESSQGVVGSIMMGDVPPENTVRIGDYPQEIVIGVIEAGSMLCHNLVLFGERQQLQLKALKASVVYCLDLKVLNSLVHEHPEFEKAVKRHKEKLFRHDFDHNSTVKFYSPLDYLSLSGLNECRYQSSK